MEEDIEDFYGGFPSLQYVFIKVTISIMNYLLQTLKMMMMVRSK